MKTWYKIKAANNGTHEILIYGDIGESWSDESVIARDLVQEISNINASEIVVRINSQGGSVSDGVAIYNALRRHPAKIIVEIDGMAVSIASLIAMAGDIVRIAPTGSMMLHAPWVTASGNAKELRETSDMLDKVTDTMVPPYASRLGEKRTRELLTDGQNHWFTASEAIEAGLADELSESLAIAAHLDLSKYGEIPMAKKPESKPTNTPDLKVIEIENAAQAKERERINARNNEIIQAFAPHLHVEGMTVLKDEVLGDLSISVTQAREMALKKIGEGYEPINSPSTHQPGTIARDGYAHAGDNRHQKEFFDAVSDTLLIRAGVPVDKPHAAANDVRGMSLVQIASSMIGHRGMAFNDKSPNNVIRAAMTTSDFPLLLANVADKALMRGYENEPASHRIWTREVELNDFKPTSRVAISEAPELQEILEGGEYREGSLGERAESYALKTFGRMMVLTRKSIINDDLGGFTRIPMAFGAAAARKEADMVYQTLVSNPNMSDGTPLFDADHANLETEGSAINVESLGAAKSVMRRQKGIGGSAILNIVPRYLIVPSVMETTAEVLLSAMIDPAKQNDTKNPAWIRNLDLVVEPRLDEVSETEWYLAADHNQVDTFEIAHLAGQRGVFTEDETEFTTDNYRVKARLDFATQVIDWVGLYKNTGA